MVMGMGMGGGMGVRYVLQMVSLCSEYGVWVGVWYVYSGYVYSGYVFAMGGGMSCIVRIIRSLV